MIARKGARSEIAVVHPPCPPCLLSQDQDHAQGQGHHLHLLKVNLLQMIVSKIVMACLEWLIYGVSLWQQEVGVTCHLVT